VNLFDGCIDPKDVFPCISCLDRYFNMEYLVSFGVLLLLIISLIQQGLCQDGRTVSGNSDVVIVQDVQNDGPQEKDIFCYICNSKRDPNCGDKQWNPHFVKLVNCSDDLYMNDFGKELIKKVGKTKPNMCRKQVQRVSLGKKQDIRVIRSCGFMPQHKRYEDDDDYVGDERCFTRAGTFEVMVTYCTCTKDKCNAGNKFGMNPWIPLALSSVTSIFVLLHRQLGHSQ